MSLRYGLHCLLYRLLISSYVLSMPLAMHVHSTSVFRQYFLSCSLTAQVGTRQHAAPVTQTHVFTLSVLLLLFLYYVLYFRL